MTNTTLDIVQQRIKAIIAAIGGGTALFAGVFEEGDPLDRTTLPIAVLEFHQEDVLETASKTKQTLPFSIIFEFAVPDGGGTKPREVGNSIVGELKKAFASDRVLKAAEASGVAIDTRYVGGGGMYLGLDNENRPASWSGLIDFETDYRHMTLDPTVTA